MFDDAGSQVSEEHWEYLKGVLSNILDHAAEFYDHFDYPQYEWALRVAQKVLNGDPEEVVRVMAGTSPATYLFRTYAAFARAYVDGSTPEDTARALFGTNDQATTVLTRAATNPATITNAGWAGTIAQQSVDDTIAAIASLSAGAELLTRGRQVDLSGIGHLTVPGRVVNGRCGWGVGA